jgi:carboxyl-terminal processing protease
MKRTKELYMSLLLILTSISIGCSLPLVKKDRDTRGIELIKEAYGIIRERYFEEKDPSELAHRAIEGMTSGLDAHSDFVEPESFGKGQMFRSGIYGWTGIHVGKRGERIEVVSVDGGSPAEMAGIVPGDFIVSIDGKQVGSLRNVVSMLDGPPDTDVRILLEKGDGSKKEVVVRRKAREIRVVWHRILDGGIGYIRISRFNTKVTSKQFFEALEILSGCKGLVIDLRQNYGGFLDQALEVADPFLEEGKEIVRVVSRYKPYNRSFKATGKKETIEVRTVLLVDEGTASVSEVLVAALKDWGKAVVVGTKTFGKGSVQDIVPLSDGSGLKLTVGRYLRPSGEEIEGVGIKPDVEVRLSPEQKSALLDRFLSGIDLGNPDMDPQLEEAIKILGLQ